ncbi:MAG: hypothetical protein K1W38_27395 [Lachnospiraceae bacterium]
MGHIFKQVAQGKLLREQANQQLLELLHLTMPEMNSGRRIYRVPFRTEYTLLNHIAINLRKDGKVAEAVQIYEELMQCYKNSKVLMKFHAVPGITLFINYTGFLEAYNDLPKAEEIGKEGLNHNLLCCRGDMVGNILANLSLVYGKQDLPIEEETYLRYGYYLICLYGGETTTGILKKAYMDKFNKKID